APIASRGARGRVIGTAAHFPDSPRRTVVAWPPELVGTLHNMRVMGFGTGYVWLVTGACLADVGNHVVCVDIDDAKFELLNQGEIPIYEPGLDEIVKRSREAGRLTFTTDPAVGVAHGIFQFIAVGTPAESDGAADLSHVLSVARTIGEYLEEYRIVVT